MVRIYSDESGCKEKEEEREIGVEGEKLLIIGKLEKGE